MQLIVNAFIKAMGLIINVRKTKILHQPVPNKCTPGPNIKIEDTALKKMSPLSHTWEANWPSTATIDKKIIVPAVPVQDLGDFAGGSLTIMTY